MKSVKLRFTHEAAKTQELSIPAVQATALVYGEVYEISEALAEQLLAQGGWEAVAPTTKSKPKEEPDAGAKE